jgi:hypothetical protein
MKKSLSILVCLLPMLMIAQNKPMITLDASFPRASLLNQYHYSRVYNLQYWQPKKTWTNAGTFYSIIYIPFQNRALAMPNFRVGVATGFYKKIDARLFRLPVQHSLQFGVIQWMDYYKPQSGPYYGRNRSLKPAGLGFLGAYSLGFKLNERTTLGPAFSIMSTGNMKEDILDPRFIMQSALRLTITIGSVQKKHIGRAPNAAEDLHK